MVVETYKSSTSTSISFVNFHSIHSSCNIIKAVQGNSCWTDTWQTWTESFWCVLFFNYGHHLYSMLGIYCSKASKIKSRRGVGIIFNYNILNDNYTLFPSMTQKTALRLTSAKSALIACQLVSLLFFFKFERTRHKAHIKASFEKQSNTTSVSRASS